MLERLVGMGLSSANVCAEDPDHVARDSWVVDDGEDVGLGPSCRASGQPDFTISREDDADLDGYLLLSGYVVDASCVPSVFVASGPGHVLDWLPFAFGGDWFAVLVAS